ncbi:conserved hypothetical protein [Ricinus communis]|uniref:CCHC-type domain-containing protein n=1 Tax=Ricinus communis TaxID=3988 RepID=B9RDX9_RICCO|nr:conserved hypothetical protein [Ricinus communis]
MKGKIIWSETGLPVLEPASARKMLDIPKKVRRKNKEEPKKVRKLSRKSHVMSCGLCNNKGHNRKGCPNMPAAPKSTSSRKQQAPKHT